MFKSRPLYLILLLTLIFAACQKTDMVGANDYKTLGTSARNLLVAYP
jgi:hypothetical protein